LKLASESASTQNPPTQSPPREQGSGALTLADASGSVQGSSESITITRDGDQEFSVSGILYGKDGKPAAGATILLYESENSGPTEIVNEAPPIHSDNAGRFEIKGKKMFAILARSADGSDFFFHKIPQKPEEAPPEEHSPAAQLVRGQMLTGQVVDKAGKPIEGATVGYYSQHRLNDFTKSGADGRFTLYYPQNSPKVLSIFAFKSKAGLDYRLFGSEFGDNMGPQPLNTDIDLTQSFTLTLDGAETVRVKAQWEDGTPAAGITIAPWTLRNPNYKDFVPASGFSDPSFNFAIVQYFTRQETGADGIVEFDWMPAWADRIGFFYADFPWWAPNVPWLRLDIDIKNDSREKTLILHRKRKATGTVRFPDGTPAEGITVKYEGVNLTYDYKQKGTTTNADGRYEMDIEPEAAYILVVDNPEWGAPAYIL
jgi:5-hydroxyisourate hydrolase-like protein (transthyretin family)